MSVNNEKKPIAEYKELITDKFTPAQRLAIDSIGSNVLVMASAGSGKTTVMLERIINLVINKGIPVKRLLVVTFVNNVAGEIKERLFHELRKKYKTAPNEYLFRQIQDVSVSNISTIHGFCNDLIKSYFYKADVSPDYKIATNEDCGIYKQEALEKVTNAYYESENPVFLDLISIFKSGRTDKKLKEVILSIYEYSRAKADPDRFFSDSVKYYDDDEYIIKLFDVYMKKIEQRVALISNELLDCLECLNRTALIAQAEDCEKFYNASLKLLEEKNLNVFLTLIKGIEFGRIPVGGVKNSQAIEKEAYEKYKSVRSGFKTFCGEFAFSSDNLIGLTKDTAKYVKCLCGITGAFKDEYAKIKREHNVLDFNDLEEKTVLLLSDSGFCDEVRSKFDYIFVDEYQDTNAVQEYILTKISNGRNMFMVGDAKQSIYAFRLCDPQIFLDKYALYKSKGGGLALEFNKNFRSGKRVLDFCNVIFSNLMNKETGGIDYKNTAMLEYGGKAKDMGDAVEVISILQKSSEAEAADRVYSVKDANKSDAKNSAYYEAQVIANKIVELVGKAEIYDDTLKANRKVRYGDITILLRSLKGNNLKLYKNLQELGIPMSAEIGNAISSEIKVLIDFLRIVDNYKNDVPLVAVMGARIGGFSDNELAKIKLCTEKENLPFHKRVKKYAEDNKDYLSEKLNVFFDLLREFNLKSSFKPVSELLIEIVKRTSYDAFILTLKNGESRVVKLNNFIAFLGESEIGQTIEKFLKNISEIEESIKLSLNAANNFDSVSLMTVHKSKGLEFPIVIFAGAGNRFNRRADEQIGFSNNFGLGMRYYDIDKMIKSQTVNNVLINSENTENDMFEELRVLYVCLTRAKNKLIITGIDSKNIEDEQMSSQALVKSVSFLQLINFAMNNCGDDILNQIGVKRTWVSSDNIDILNKGEENCAFLPEYDFDEGLKRLNRLRKPYPHECATKLQQKFTVTEINEAGEDKVFFKPEDSDEEIAEDMTSDERILCGVCQHKILEHLDFSRVTFESIEKTATDLLNSGELSAKHLSVLDKQSVYNVAKSDFIQNCIKNKVYRELPFLLKLPASEIFDTDCDDFVMIQGQIDMLVIEKGKATVVDFKYTSVTDSEIIKKRYAKQLELYAKAVKKVFGFDEVDRVIYNISKGFVLKID